MVAAISVANRQSGGEDGCYREKFRNFIVLRSQIKKQFFAFLGYPSTILRTAYRKEFYGLTPNQYGTDGKPMCAFC